MAEFPALPIFTDAYIADTGDLSTEEHGAYLLLLMLAWRRPDCAIPDDMPWLKRALHGYASDMHGNRFNKIVPELLKRFFVKEIDGKFHQKRLRKERDFLKKRSETQREIANKRWHENRENNDLANATVMPPGNAPTPTPTPILIVEKEKDTIVSKKKKYLSLDEISFEMIDPWLKENIPAPINFKLEYLACKNYAFKREVKDGMATMRSWFLRAQKEYEAKNFKPALPVRAGAKTILGGNHE